MTTEQILEEKSNKEFYTPPKDEHAIRKHERMLKQVDDLDRRQECKDPNCQCRFCYAERQILPHLHQP